MGALPSVAYALSQYQGFVFRQGSTYGTPTTFLNLFLGSFSGPGRGQNSLKTDSESPGKVYWLSARATLLSLPAK